MARQPRQNQEWQGPAFDPLPAQPTREDIRQAARLVLATPPTSDLHTWARIFRSMARAHAPFDLETAIAIQEQAQRMGATAEGARTLARMRAEQRVEAPLPVSEADRNSRCREHDQLQRRAMRPLSRSRAPFPQGDSYCTRASDD